MRNLYEVSASDDGLTYNFTTKYGIKYIIALTTYDILGVSAYSLNVYPIDDHPKCPIDYFIKNTIINIIGRILEKEENVVIYVCENSDGKEEKRRIAFDRWYSSGKLIYPNVLKYDHCVRTQDGYVINSSLIYNNQNPLSDYIIQSYKELMALF